VGSLGVVEQDLPRLSELEPLHVELGEEVRVVWYVEQRPEAHGAVVVSAAALGAGGPPFAAHVLDVSAPPADGAVGAPHVLPESGGHGLLARVGKVDARHVAESSAHHVLDDVVTDPRHVGVDSSNGAPAVLYPLHVAYHGAVRRLKGKPVEMPEVPVAAPGLDHGDDAVVPLLPEVSAHVEVAAKPRVQVHVVDAVVLGQGYEARCEPDVEVLGPFAQHLPFPAGGVAGELLPDGLHDLRAEGSPGRQRLVVRDRVGAEGLAPPLVEHAVEDAVRVPGRALGDEVAVGGVEGEEDGGVQVLVVAYEVALHQIDDLRGVAAYCVGDRGLGEDLAAVPEPDDGPQHVPVAEVGPVEPRAPALKPPQVLAQGLESDVLDLVVLWRRHEDEAAGVPEADPEELGHAVERLPRLPCLDVGDEVRLVPEERIHVVERRVAEPLPAELDGVGGDLLGLLSLEPLLLSLESSQQLFS